MYLQMRLHALLAEGCDCVGKPLEPIETRPKLPKIHFNICVDDVALTSIITPYGCPDWSEFAERCEQITAAPFGVELHDTQADIMLRITVRGDVVYFTVRKISDDNPGPYICTRVTAEAAAGAFRRAHQLNMLWEQEFQ